MTKSKKLLLLALVVVVGGLASVSSSAPSSSSRETNDPSNVQDGSPPEKIHRGTNDAGDPGISSVYEDAHRNLFLGDVWNFLLTILNWFDIFNIIPDPPSPPAPDPSKPPTPDVTPAPTNDSTETPTSSPTSPPTPGPTNGPTKTPTTSPVVETTPVTILTPDQGVTVFYCDESLVLLSGQESELASLEGSIVGSVLWSSLVGNATVICESGCAGHVYRVVSSIEAADAVGPFSCSGDTSCRKVTTRAATLQDILSDDVIQSMGLAEYGIETIEAAFEQVCESFDSSRRSMRSLVLGALFVPDMCMGWQEVLPEGLCKYTNCFVGENGDGYDCFSCGRTCDNSCGPIPDTPEDALINAFIPESIPGVFDFTESCCIHDHCYSTVFGKLDCDLAFLVDNLLSCNDNSIHFLGFPVPELGSNLPCEIAAVVYFLAVFFGGADSYTQAQAKQAVHNSGPICSRPQHETIATMWGDPHIVTFDGLKYDCQALGEVTLLKSLDSDDFVVQGRFVPWRSGSFPTRMDGVAIKDGSLLLQLTRDSNGQFEFFVNGIVSTFESGNGFLVEGTTLVLDSGVSISFGSFGRFALSLPAGFRPNERLIGILGSPNSNGGDEWMFPNGTLVPYPSTPADFLYQVAYEYCTNNWCVESSEESLFTYKEGTSFETDFACNRSRGYDDTVELAVQNPPQCLSVICGDSLECLIDGVLLGREGATDSSAENLFATCDPSPAKECYFSCVDALAMTCDTTSGVISICPSGLGDEAVDVYCDQETDGGGWMLLYSYKHMKGNNDELVSTLIPTDPDNGYSHFIASSIGYSSVDIDDVRLYCTTSAHDRVMHFKTDHPIVKAMAMDGETTGNSVGVWSDFQCFTVELEGHSAFLPRTTNNVLSGNLVYFPFFESRLRHWGIRADFGGVRYECDDIGGGVNEVDTLHNVWARMSQFPRCDTSSLVTETVRDSCMAHKQAGFDQDGFYLVNTMAPFSVYCDQSRMQGGWALYAHHRDTVDRVIRNVVSPCEFGVSTPQAWQALQKSMADGMMFVDENEKVSFISADKLRSADSCVAVQNVPNLTSTRNQQVGVQYIWHSERSGCITTGLDYSLIVIGDGGSSICTTLPVTNANCASLYNYATVKFDIWPYAASTSYLEQNELFYFLR